MKQVLIILFVLLINNLAYATDWESSSDFRMGYVEYDYANPPSKTSSGRIDSRGVYLSSKTSILTPKYQNFSLKATVAGVTDFGINNSEYETRNYVFDNGDKSSFAIFQEFFISYLDETNNLTIGRQEIVTPLVESDDYYFIANSFDAINYINSSVNNFSFHLGYFYQMSGVWDSGANGTEFHSMSDSSFVDKKDKVNANNSGVVYGAVEYTDKNQRFKVWDYYTTDLYNMLFLEYIYSNSNSNFSYNLGFQIVNYKEVGALASNNYTNIDYSIFSIKFDGDLNSDLSFSTAVTKYTNGEGQGATLGAWGGFPTYSYGLAHSFFNMGSLQNSMVSKIHISYDLESIGLTNTSLSYRYTNYALDSVHSNSEDYMILNGIKLSYSSSNGGYFKAIYEDRDLDNADGAFAVRIIGGYKF